MDAEDIERREFAAAFRGYDRGEVDLYLREVAQEVRAMGKEVSKAKQAADKAISDLSALKAERAKVSEPEEPAQSSGKAEAYRQVGEETARVLLAAEAAANEIREAGRHEVTQMITEARRKAQQIVKDASHGRTEIEDDIKRLKQTRASLAAQLDDIKRRLADAVARLHAPLEPPPPVRLSRPPEKQAAGPPSKTVPPVAPK
ncbi:MAG: DivIVA domain-containing protein, partial [Actinomycetota bacterium]